MSINAPLNLGEFCALLLYIVKIPHKDVDISILDRLLKTILNA